MCFDITKNHFRFGEDAFRFSEGSGPNSLCFVGVLDQYFSVESTPQKILQVVFTPCGAFRFLRMSMSTFTNVGTDAQVLFTDIRDTIARMEDFHGNEETCIMLLEQYFLGRLRNTSLRLSEEKVTQISYACQLIKNTAGNISIKKLCRLVNISENRFRVHFNEKVGVSPKAFCQTERLFQVKEILLNSEDADWIALCENFNFFDQAHFIKSFKTQFGCTPRQFVKSYA